MTRFQITWDCTSPSRMTRFWSQALGYKVEEPPNGFETWNDYWLSIGVSPDELDMDGAGGGRSVDLSVRKQRVLEQEGLDHYAEVMADPEHNEFCIN